MNDDDSDTTAVLDAVRGSLGTVTMRTPVERIVAAGRRRKHTRAAAATAGAAAVAGLAVAAATTTAPDPGGVHVHTAAYTVDSGADGSVRLTWDKRRYFEDRDGMQAALRQAGMPVLVKVGEFCHGPQDDPAVSASGTGPGVDLVMHGESPGGGGHGAADEPGSGGKPADGAPGDGGPADKARAEKAGADPATGKSSGAEPAPGAAGAEETAVTLVFDPSAMPAGKQLFIGYLTADQLAVTGGHPGSVERLVPTDVPLICTTELPTR